MVLCKDFPVYIVIIDIEFQPIPSPKFTIILVSLPARLKVKCESPKHNLLVHIGLVSYHIMVHTSWSRY